MDNVGARSWSPRPGSAGGHGDRGFVDLACGTDARLQGALDPGVPEGAVLAGEVDPALRTLDVRLQAGLLARPEECEGPPGAVGPVPGVGRSALRTRLNPRGGCRRPPRADPPAGSA